MDNLFEEAQSPNAERTIKELERRSQDRIRVFNPTPNQYIVRFDGRGFSVPGSGQDIGFGKGQAIHPRWIAEKYAKEMATYILEKEMIDATTAENIRRVNSGNRAMDKWMGGEEQIFAERYRPDNSDKRSKLFSILILGVEEQFGMNVTEDEVANIPQRDPRSMDDVLLAALDRPAKPLSDEDLPQISDLLNSPAVSVSNVLITDNPQPIASGETTEHLLESISQ